MRTLDTDREHLHNHTKWSQRAIAWNEKDKSADLLLRGSELAVAQAWLKDTQEQKKQPAATELQKEYIAKSSGHERKNRLLLTGAVVSVMGVMTAAAIGSTMLWLKAQRQTEIAERETKIATLRENAARVQTLLPVEPVEALILAIKATGESQSSSQEVREKSFSQVQSSLRDASADARERNILQGHQGEVNSAAFSPDCKTIVSGGGDGMIRLWDSSGNPIGQPIKGHQGKVNSVAFSPDCKTIVSGDRYGIIRLWNTRGKPINQPIKGHQGVMSVAFSPDGKTIVSGSGDIRLWDTIGNPIGQPFKGHQRGVNSVAFSPDSKTIVSGGSDKTIRLWDTSGNPIGQPFKGHQDQVISVAFSPNSKTIVSGDGEGTIRLWDTSGNPIGQLFKGHENQVRSVAFSPDGKTIVSGSLDSTIRLWDTLGNPVRRPFTGHEGWVSSVAFSPDGKTIVSGSNDNAIRLWDTKGNLIGQPFTGHEGWVWSVAFSPDGKTIVSGSADKTIRLWRGGNWQDWLGVACDRLIEHPILVDPETLLGEDVEMIEVAKDARSTCQNSVWNKTENAQFLVNQGRAIGRGGDVKGAITKFQQARKLSSNIQVPTEEKVGWWAAGALVEKGEKLVKEGKVKEALAAYQEAQRLKPTWKLYADSWNTLCRYGSLHGQAAAVMQACEKAVALAPKNGEFRDSRGIARALTGDKPGAIEDFQAFIKSTNWDKWKKQRQRWIDALKAGKNPFTPEEIEKLKG